MPAHGPEMAGLPAALRSLASRVGRLERRKIPAATTTSVDIRTVYLDLVGSGGAPSQILGSSSIPKNDANGAHDVGATIAVVANNHVVLLRTPSTDTRDYSALGFEVTQIADASGTPIAHVHETQSNPSLWSRTGGVVSASAYFTGTLFTTASSEPAGITITTPGWYIVYAALTWT